MVVSDRIIIKLYYDFLPFNLYLFIMKKIKGILKLGIISNEKIITVSVFIAVMIFRFMHAGQLCAQPEVMAWGNITGIRVEGQLMGFESSLRVVGKNWLSFNATGREKQRPKYERDGIRQSVTTGIGGIKFAEVIEGCGKGCAKVSIRTTSEADTLIEGVFFCISLQDKEYKDATVRPSDKASSVMSGIILSDFTAGNTVSPNKLNTKGIIIATPKRTIEINSSSRLPVYFKRESNNSDVTIYFGLLGGKVRKGMSDEKTFTIITRGEIDKSPVEIVLDSQNPGRRFDGLGGNFRLQNPGTDPQVIQYCLENLRVAWGRVEMPWAFWHPDENSDPSEAARSGKLNPRVQAAMQMAQRLAARGIPVIVSDWSAPAWAILGDPRDAFRFRSKGIYGYQLNPEKLDKIYNSICDYLVYMKDNYGVEAAMFSFNESDLGINVRHTGREHAEFIKGLGARMASRGLATKMLLGDNSDATTFEFIVPAMDDPEAYRYIGAVSFHSWRGCTDEILKKWAGAARQLNLPLIVAEGSTDAAAWNYPQIFSEQSFALYEINLYTRICSICQPLSILQWQMTADYSVLTGGGIFGIQGPLHPTQRFWNLKQLASTPEGSFSIPLQCSKEAVNCAAFGNISRGEFAVHIVNNGAERHVSIKGIPPGIEMFVIYQTDNVKGMEKVGEVKVVNSVADFNIGQACFTTLINLPGKL